jgi:hypothetical protein
MENPQRMRFYNFQSVELVHIGTGLAAITEIAKSSVAYTDDIGRHSTVDLEECARTYAGLRRLGAFPPADTTNWSELVDSISDFATLPLSRPWVVGLRAAADEPPWFQFLNRRRTQFEFKDYDHIQNALLTPLARAGAWQSWDAS